MAAIVRAAGGQPIYPYTDNPKKVIQLWAESNYDQIASRMPIDRYIKECEYTASDDETYRIGLGVLVGDGVGLSYFVRIELPLVKEFVEFKFGLDDFSGAISHFNLLRNTLVQEQSIWQFIINSNPKSRRC